MCARLGLYLSLWVGGLGAAGPVAWGQGMPADASTVVRRRLDLEVITAENVSRLEEIHSESVRLTSLAWRPDSREIVGIIAYRTAQEEGVEVRDAETFEVLKNTALGRRITSFTFNPRLPLAAWVTMEGKVEVLHLETGDGYYLEDVGRGPNVSFRPDGKVLVVGGQSGSLRFYEAESGEWQRTIELGKDRFVVTPVFNADGPWVTAAPFRETTKIWNSEKGEERCAIKVLNNQSTMISALLDPAGERLLALPSGMFRLQIWNAATGESLPEKDMEDQAPVGLRWMQGGKLLAGVGQGTLAFWKGPELTLLQEHEGPKNTMAFGVSPDGRRLVAISRGTVAGENLLQAWGVVAKGAGEKK
ncbi:MAG: WD40 repeat domain-containing protein [Planctomycetaceae bacterium]